MTQVSLVISPQLTFVELSRKIRALGWTRQANGAVEPPLIPGEPEFASWSRGEDGRVSYTFNPAVKLRALVFYGPHAGEQSAEVERALPTLGLPELRELLQSKDTRQLLLGVFVARELKAFTLLNLFEPLLSHQETTVARAARKAHEELLQVAIDIGAERLRQQKKRHPERSTLFAHLGDAHMRRQTIRWLIRDYREANEHVLAVLRSGLADEDWEVRATAMLAAVRLRATELGGELRHMELPKTSRNGPDETDRSILFAARRIALEYLTRHTAEPQISLDHASMDESHYSPKEAVLQHLRRCMLGLPVTRHDRVFLFINALTEPLEVEGPPPPDSPAIIAHEGTYRLKRSRLQLCWIPPVAHWLGTDDEDSPVQNPIRQVIPDRGFFVARFLLSVSSARQIFSNTHQEDRADGTDSQETHLCNWAEAVNLCERLSKLECVTACLPTADQWEIATRGPDGRRFPWGNNARSEARFDTSPWGLIGAVGLAAQWSSSMQGSEVLVCGGEKQWVCAMREPASRDSLRAVRLVVEP
jgi:hypothetical protein